jgi:hypothetical protein
MKDKLNLFDVLNSIFYKKDIKYDKKVASAYRMILWTSHDPELLVLSNKINKRLFTHSDKGVYEILYSKVPKGSRYIKWIKKQEIPEEKLPEIEELMKKYEMSEREARLTLGV